MKDNKETLICMHNGSFDNIMLIWHKQMEKENLGFKRWTFHFRSSVQKKSKDFVT